MHPILRLLLIGSLCALSGCGGSSRSGLGGEGERFAGLDCAPFARELSGIALYGDAASWWDQAEGTFLRTSEPIIGSVLVFRRSARLPAGHVAVVTFRLGAREILVTQANWVRNELDLDQRVIDVSERNDWSLVRVWYPPVRQLGVTQYATFGFIAPRVEATHDGLMQASRAAAQIAVGSRFGQPSTRARPYGF